MRCFGGLERVGIGLVLGEGMKEFEVAWLEVGGKLEESFTGERLGEVLKVFEGE